MKKAILSGNVDITEGVIFVREGQFYGEEVYSKYPKMFVAEEVVEVEPVIEPVGGLTIEPVIEQTPIVHHQQAHIVHITPPAESKIESTEGSVEPKEDEEA